MTDDALTDAERIAIGCDPLREEQLHDLDDLWHVLRRLGHDPSDAIPRTVWEGVSWSCPVDDCDGGLEPVDTRMRDLPVDPDDLDESVSLDESEEYLRLSKARSSTVPVVACYMCHSAFKTTFRRLRDPEEWNLPEPRIVETPDTLHGRPRIDGTRIGVEHIWTFHRRGYTAGEISKQVYPSLSEGHVNVAIEWVQEHPETMDTIRRENEEIRRQHDILQSAVDAAVEESLDSLWTAMVNAKSSDEIDPVRPIASLLRTGFENADRLGIEIDTEDRRVVIHVGNLLDYLDDLGEEPLPDK